MERNIFLTSQQCGKFRWDSYRIINKNKGRSPNKKTGKCGNFSQVGGPPPPPPSCLGMTRLFEGKNHVFFCILGGVSHVKNS